MDCGTVGQDGRVVIAMHVWLGSGRGLLMRVPAPTVADRAAVLRGVPNYVAVAAAYLSGCRGRYCSDAVPPTRGDDRTEGLSTRSSLSLG
jgi:hypothetical protein